MKTPKYITDTAHSNDFFKIHSQIADTIYDIIKSEDITTHSFTLGLFGKWGSGKSLTIKQLRDKIKPEDKIILFEFDVWKYIDSSLYRSILFDLEKQLVVYANDENTDPTIKKHFISGYKNSDGESLNQILNSNTEKSIITTAKKENNWTKIDDYLNQYPKLKILNIIVKPFHLLSKMCAYAWKRWEIIILIVLFIVAFYLLHQNKTFLFSFFKINDSLKYVLKIVVGIGLGLAALEFLKEFLKDFFKDLLPKNNYTLVSSPPTFAQDQFEIIFSDLISKLTTIKNSTGKQKIIIVFDNIDRCESEVACKALAGLKTFMDLPNCFYVIPCDELEINKHLKRSGSESGFIDKIFQSYLRIPPIIENEKYEFIDECLKKAQFELSKEDKAKIIQILSYAYSGETPRQIKRFFNDFISYYKLSLVIDEKKTFLLDNIGMFTFMVTIKQKWTAVEDFLIKYPTLLRDFKLSGSPVSLPTGFESYLNNCINWIDLEKNPLNYIYLKEVKQSGLIVQKILLEEYDDFVINESLIHEINDSLKEYLRKQYWGFFENGIERLKQFLDKEIKNGDVFIVNKLFNCYWQNIVYYENLRLDPAPKSFLLRHADFLGHNVDLFKRLEINTISGAQLKCIQILKDEGFNTTTSSLFKIFLTHFNLNVIKEFFYNVPQDKIIALQQFVLLIPSDEIKTFIPESYLNQLASIIGFQGQSDETIKIFEYIKANNIPNSTALIISSKATELVSSIVNARARHQFEPNVIRGLSLLNNSILGSEKVALDNVLWNRINFLLQINISDLAVEYIIEALLLINTPEQVEQLKNGFRNTTSNRFIGSQLILDHLLNKIDSQKLEKILCQDIYNQEILQAIKNHNRWTPFYKKLSTEFILNNENHLLINDLGLIQPLLGEINERKTEKNVAFINTIERNVYDYFILNNKEVLITNYHVVLNSLVKNDVREEYIEECLSSFFQDYSTNQSKIFDLFGNISLNNNPILLRKFYEKHKIKIVNSYSSELFQKIYEHLEENQKAEYLKRMLEKGYNSLLASETANDVLDGLAKKVNKNFYDENKNLILNITIELLEISRSESENKIAIEIIKQGKFKVTKKLSDKMVTLLTEGQKSEDLNKELQELVKK